MAARFYGYVAHAAMCFNISRVAIFQENFPHSFSSQKLYEGKQTANFPGALFKHGRLRKLFVWHNDLFTCRIHVLQINDLLYNLIWKCTMNDRRVYASTRKDRNQKGWNDNVNKWCVFARIIKSGAAVCSDTVWMFHRFIGLDYISNVNQISRCVVRRKMSNFIIDFDLLFHTCLRSGKKIH